MLRRSIKLKPSPEHLAEDVYREPHRRGEILVAAVLNAFLAVWTERLKAHGQFSGRYLNRDRVVEEGANVADYLLTMMIRAIDYTPPVHICFNDFLSAVLTSDREINPNDDKYRFRDTLTQSFKDFGIDTASQGTALDPGIWKPPSEELSYDRTHFESMQRDPDEIFRFIWENRRTLGLYEDAYSRVLTVRPCLRIGSDGFALRETVVEYIQLIDLTAGELKRIKTEKSDKGRKIEKPEGMPDSQKVKLFGGGAMIFDEYGQLKYHVRNRLNNAVRQSERLAYLWEVGFFRRASSKFHNFAALHRLRAVSSSSQKQEEW